MTLELWQMSMPPAQGHVMLFDNPMLAYRIDDANFYVNAADASEVLGYANTESMLKHIDKTDRMSFKKLVTDGPEKLIKIEDNSTFWLKDVSNIPNRNIKPISKSYKDFYGVDGRSVYINEKALYDAILSGNTTECKAFKDYVTGTVLPNLRIKGSFMVGAKSYWALDLLPLDK